MWFVNYVLPIIITVISGVMVYMFGELLNTIWLNPLQEYKNLKREIAKWLLFYANIYSNVLNDNDSSEDWIKLHFVASDKLRSLASDLEGFIQVLSWVKIGIPKKSDLKSAASSLILLSNCMFDSNPTKQSKENHNMADDIREKLNIYIEKEK